MQLRDKLIVAGMVLATGGSGAFWFRKPATEAPKGAHEQPAQNLVLREQFNPGPSVASDAKYSAPAAPLSFPTEEKEPEKKASLEGDAPVPDLAPHFQPAFNIGYSNAPNTNRLNTVPWATPTPAPAKPADQGLPSSWTFEAARTTANFPSAPLQPLLPAPAAPRNAVNEPADPPTPHVVADGDTLSKLAADYLGSASRRLEIFNANRAVLKDPEILPIGVEIMIPPKTSFAAPGSPSSNGLPPLVPIEKFSGT
ncbi:MAG TPA: hypothetical protein VFE24_07975 [Pirellulales bacterium]|jgi:nucleoid-associated protein YgaU|nr:hypothetical protein [Pirellulales bacterium]